MRGELDFISTRQFRQSDINEVIKINRTCLPENYSRFFFLKEASRTPKAFRVFENNQKVHGYVIGRVEGFDESLYGLLRSSELEEETNWFNQFENYLRINRFDKWTGHIVSIAVLPRFRHRGIGSRLLNDSIDAMKLREISMVYLEVRKSNAEAIALYKKHGFQIASTIQNYYISQREDAYLMVLLLDPNIDFSSL